MNKKVIVPVISLMLVVGCSDVESQETKTTPATYIDIGDVNSNGYMFDYVDKKTGCRYLIWSGYKQAGITPALKPDGKPDCESGDQQ